MFSYVSTGSSRTERWLISDACSERDTLSETNLYKNEWSLKILQIYIEVAFVRFLGSNQPKVCIFKRCFNRKPHYENLNYGRRVLFWSSPDVPLCYNFQRQKTNTDSLLWNPKKRKEKLILVTDARFCNSLQKWVDDHTLKWVTSSQQR